AISGLHGNGAYGRLPQVLGDLRGNLLTVAIHLTVNFEGIIDRRQVTTGKFHVYHWPDNLHDFASAHTLSLYRKFFNKRAQPIKLAGSCRAQHSPHQTGGAIAVRSTLALQ